MRTDYCGNIDTRFLGQGVTLFGWAHRRRDHGGVIFIDLRDREGLVQVVCDPDRKDTFATADLVRNEFVLRVQGVVRRRPEGTVNADLKSGEVEVLAHEIEVLNSAKTPPFMMDDEQISEEVRLRHRYLDLRRPAMQRVLRMRHQTARAVREYLDDNGFVDVETPVLYKSTPEGAREFLVPSRIHDGQFYALPQSPQLFKQILMVAGYDRYYQIVKCFRDEDLRADRQPEFTRKELDDLTPFVAIYGAKGLAYIRVNDPAKLNEEGLQSPIVKFLSPEVLGAIIERTGARAGDVIFFGADRRKVVNDALGALRSKVGHEKGHAEKGAWRPLWVLDFPAFEYDEENKRWAAAHHPFTSPKDEHVALLESDPGKVLAKAYDIALNGWELGGGSVRIHRGEIQAKQFATLGIGEAEQRAKFGWLLDALAYGAPPHGGIAFGLDRMVAMLAGVDQIRDVMAFPKTQRGQDLMVETPTPVTERQLRELHIRLRNVQGA